MFHSMYVALRSQESTLSIQLDLRHGGHLQFLDSLNETLDIKRYAPHNTKWGNKYIYRERER